MTPETGFTHKRHLAEKCGIKQKRRGINVGTKKPGVFQQKIGVQSSRESEDLARMKDVGKDRNCECFVYAGVKQRVLV